MDLDLGASGNNSKINSVSKEQKKEKDVDILKRENNCFSLAETKMKRMLIFQNNQNNFWTNLNEKNLTKNPKKEMK